MSRALAIGRTLAARRPPPAPQTQRHLQGTPDSVAARIAKLSELERAELSKHLDKMEQEFKCKLVQELDAYLQRPTFYNDQGKVNRVLTFCRVPRGERREKLICIPALPYSSSHLWQLASGKLADVCSIIKSIRESKEKEL